MKRRILLILITSVILVFSFGITYSFFTSNTALNSTDQNIARFIFNTESLNELQIPLIDLKPGTEEEYNFSISNNYLEHTSEVSIKYQLTIKTYHLVPLNIELYKIVDEEETLIITCDETYTRNAEGELVCNTDDQIMLHSESKLDNYKLKIVFPSEYNSSVYADLVDYINMEIRSEQIIEEQVIE